MPAHEFDDRPSRFALAGVKTKRVVLVFFLFLAMIRTYAVVASAEVVVDGAMRTQAIDTLVAELYRLSGHFHAAIPNSRSISPITHTNWEGTGVRPDVPAPPADALAVAIDLLQRRRDAGVALGVEN